MTNNLETKNRNSSEQVEKSNVLSFPMIPLQAKAKNVACKKRTDTLESNMLERALAARSLGQQGRGNQTSCAKSVGEGETTNREGISFRQRIFRFLQSGAFVWFFQTNSLTVYKAVTFKLLQNVSYFTRTVWASSSVGFWERPCEASSRI